MPMQPRHVLQNWQLETGINGDAAMKHRRRAVTIHAFRGVPRTESCARVARLLIQPIPEVEQRALCSCQSVGKTGLRLFAIEKSQNWWTGVHILNPGINPPQGQSQLVLIS